MALKKLPGGVIVETTDGVRLSEDAGVNLEAIHRQIVAGVGVQVGEATAGVIAEATAAADRAEAAASEAASDATAAIATQVDVVQRAAAQVADRVTSGADPEIVAAVVDAESRRTWIEAGADGGPTAHARRHIGVEDDPARSDVLAVSDGTRIVPIIDSHSRLSPLLLRWSSRYGRAEVPAAAGGVRSDAALVRNVAHGGAWEPTSGTDDTALLEALIRSVSEDDRGGRVILPPGMTMATIGNLPPNVSLAGAGRRQTALIAPAGSNRSVITVGATGSQKSYRTEITSLTIHGNRWQQTGLRPRSLIDHGYTGQVPVQNGIRISQGDQAGPDEEGLDRYDLIRDVTIYDVNNVAIYSRRTPGEVRYENVTALRPGIGFISGPDSFWSDCTVGESEFAGIFNLHGSTHWSNVKVFRAGAFIVDGQTNTTAYIRRTSPGWHLVGTGGNAIISSSSAQNNGGHGLLVDTTAKLGNVQMHLDANNNLVGWGQLPPTHDSYAPIQGMQKYGADGVTVGKIGPADFAGAHLAGRGMVMSLTSITATEQNAGEYVGGQAHALRVADTAEQCDVRLTHGTNTTGGTASGDPVIGSLTGKNTIHANGKQIDKVA